MKEFHYAPIFTGSHSNDGFVVYSSQPYGEGRRYDKVGAAQTEDLAKQMVEILVQIEQTQNKS